MSWLSDKYEKLKDLWRRFERWERKHVGYEEEWYFTVYGTTEEFEQRFLFLLPTMSKNLFFHELYQWFNYNTLSYCEDGEIGLKLPNPFPYILIAIISWFTASSLYYFQGNLEVQSEKLVLRGAYQPIYKFLNGPINFFTVSLAIGVILTLIGITIGLRFLVSNAPLIEFVDALALILFGAFFAAFGFGLRYITGAFFWAYDRGASLKTQRILEEVCGSPAEPSNNQPE